MRNMGWLLGRQETRQEEERMKREEKVEGRSVPFYYMHMLMCVGKSFEVCFQISSFLCNNKGYSSTVAFNIIW